MPQLAVVILNWNGIELLQKYIPSVVTHTANTTEIYVIDNASTDKSVAFLKDNYPQIKIIVNNENY
ncbi:MAG TPA: glycosyltransferase, partial [Bacteroidales bacterium]|nr:glycosyltransferase [Bacteroidales bacterium]